MALALKGRSVTETTSHDHRGSASRDDIFPDPARRGEVKSSSSSHASRNESFTISRLALPSLGRSAATSAVFASSHATRRGTSSARSRMEKTPPTGRTTPASSFNKTSASGPWCKCDVSFPYSSSSSSSARSSTVSSHSVKRCADAIASRPSERSAKTASPRGTNVRFCPSESAASGASIVANDVRTALAGQKQTSATVAGNATVAAHMGGGITARAIGVTSTSAPSMVAVVAADETEISSTKTCSSTRPFGVAILSTSGFDRSHAQYTLGPSRVEKRTSRDKYHLPFPRRQICVAAPKSPRKSSPSSPEPERFFFSKTAASGSATHTASRSESHDHAKLVTSTPAPRAGKRNEPRRKPLRSKNTISASVAGNFFSFFSVFFASRRETLASSSSASEAEVESTSESSRARWGAHATATSAPRGCHASGGA
mmetsp:Transcript_12850/g.53867  ORF Transcript_12850/g.53867 Transcript_12850/m.53867 type:complete len:430 (-) Transcript_12850:143-1432(-)